MNCRWIFVICPLRCNIAGENPQNKSVSTREMRVEASKFLWYTK